MSGVKVVEVVRMVDESLMTELRSQHAKVGELGTYDKMYSDLATRGFGQKGSQNTFFHYARAMADSFKSLTASPMGGAKLKTLGAMESFTRSLNAAADTVQKIRGEADTLVDEGCEKVNALIREIAGLNGKIKTALIEGKDTNTYKDLRQSALHNLSEYVALTVNDSAGDGQVTVAIKTSTYAPLVMGDGYSQFVYTPAPSHRAGAVYGDMKLEGFGHVGASALVVTDALKSPLSSGKFKACLTMRDTFMPNVQKQLDAFAVQMRDEFNALYNPTGAAGGDLFVTDGVGADGTGAANALAVRADIIASGGESLLTGAAGVDGDVSIAEALGEKLALLDVSFPTAHGTGTFTTSLANYAATIIDAQEVRISLNHDAYTKEEFVYEALSSRANDVSGVDVRKEFLKLQQILSSQTLLGRAYAKITEAEQKLFDIL
jgi:flagellar hook-associated protein 1 FlgK